MTGLRKLSQALVACSLSALAATPAPALAQNSRVVVVAEPDARTERVSINGMDLATAKGAKRLHYRVASAVKRVCLFDNNRAKTQPTDYYGCADGAWDDANPQIARAIARAQQLASIGQSSIATGAITISAGR